MFQAVTFGIGVLLAGIAAVFRLPERATRVMLVLSVLLIVFSQAPGIAAWLGS